VPAVVEKGGGIYNETPENEWDNHPFKPVFKYLRECFLTAKQQSATQHDKHWNKCPRESEINLDPIKSCCLLITDIHNGTNGMATDHKEDGHCTNYIIF
jgi:hypothetical protein